jgi:hypothetical protein
LAADGAPVPRRVISRPPIRRSRSR